METIPSTAERKAELEEYLEAVQAIQEGYDEMKAGLARPAREVFEELREKYGLPRFMRVDQA
jgi:hypothetical protein